MVMSIQMRMMTMMRIPSESVLQRPLIVIYALDFFFFITPFPEKKMPR